jgi:quinoprotein glucose dehydrogenase
VSVDDLIDFTPELHAEAVKLAGRYKLGPLFTPGIVSKAEGPLQTLVLPSNTGGANWPGGSYDPETHTLYVFSQTNISQIGLIAPDPQRSDMEFISGSALARAGGAGAGGGAGSPAGGAGGAGRTAGATPEGGAEGGAIMTVQGLPLVKPPYGRITAFDMDTGEIRWQIAHGETPDAIRNHPALKGLTIPRTGQRGLAGTLVTKTLLIAGEPGYTTTSTGQRGAMVRAYDKATGSEVGAVYVPAPVTGSPMTYMLNGEQYIVVAIGGGVYSAELVAFKLPKTS